jgi:hypothetical protein
MVTFMPPGPSTHWIKGFLGPRIGLDAVKKRKIPYLFQEAKPDSSVV